MCRHLAYLGPSIYLDELIFNRPHSLEHQSWQPHEQRYGAVNADGFGVGWYRLDRRPEPALYRRSRPIWSDARFKGMAGLIDSQNFIAAVRSATPPYAVSESNTAPFHSGRFLFSHNGTLEDADGATGRRIMAGISSERLARRAGNSDSALLFSLVLDCLDKIGSPEEALVHAVHRARAAGRGRFNFLFSDGRSLSATVDDESLYLGRSAQEGYVLSSESLNDDESWTRIPGNSMVHISAGRCTIRFLS